jgi:alkyldihydroxyacetonephosphate synthase
VTPRRSFWAWGLESEEPTDEDRARRAEHLSKRFGVAITPSPVPDLADAELRPARIPVPDALAACCTTETWERAFHSHGAHFTDRTDAFNLHFPNPTDVVAHPRSEDELVAVVDWCSSIGAKVVPFGAGSSVVWGVNPPEAEAVVTVAMDRFDRVLELDPVSRAARIQAGIYGPELEAQLRPEGFTLRHFPQSFRFSTLGGWIATRSGGHFATLHTHIDEFVEAVRVVTPRGVLETRRLPASGAGPSPERLVCGSEGTLGVITEAWMRLQPRPVHRAGASVYFADFDAAVEASRELAQSGLHPSNCRLLDHDEALLSGSGDGSRAILVVGFESGDHELEPWLARALEITSAHGGERHARDGDDPAAVWRAAFLRGPHLRDAFARLGLVHETFETAVTWDRFPAFHTGVLEATRRAMQEACGGGALSCRFAYVYPDGPAPYYSVYAPGRRDQELEQWDAIKAAASEAILALGGTITHHHSVGRDHAPWYRREAPELFTAALGATKAELDPAGIMNPGVLLPPAAAHRGEDGGMA